MLAYIIFLNICIFYYAASVYFGLNFAIWRHVVAAATIASYSFSLGMGSKAAVKRQEKALAFAEKERETLKKLFARQMEVIIDVMDQDALISKQEEMSKEMDAICNTIKVKLLKEERFAFAMDVIGFLAFFCVMAFEGVYQKVSFALDLYTIMAFTLVLFVDYLDSIRQERHNKIFENITEMTNNAFAFLEKKKWKTEGALHQ